MRPVITVGEWSVSTDLNTLKSEKAELQLEPKAMRLLLLLVENAGNLVSKEQILETVWGDSFVSDSVLWHTISDLRNLLGDDSQNPRYIETVPKLGYRLVAEVKVSSPPGTPADTGPLDAVVRALTFRSSLDDGRFQPPRTPVILTWVLVIALGASAALLAVLYFGSPPPVSETLRFNIGPPEGTSLLLSNPFGGSPAISPNGQDVAFAAETGGKTRLYVHNLAQDITVPFTGTEDASFPFWSPDSQYLGFFSKGSLKKVHISGHPLEVICEAHFGLGGTWSTDGTIVFAPDFYGPLAQVSAEGGTPEPLSMLNKDRKELSHRWPYFLPDGRTYLYRVVSSESRFSGIFAGRIDSADQIQVLRDASNVQYSETGHLYFVREGVLMSQAFDSEGLVPVGKPEAVLTDVAFSPGFSLGIFSVSDRGLLVFSEPSDVRTRLSRISMEGTLISSINGTIDTERFDLSNDGQRIILDRPDAVSGKSDLWIIDQEQSSPRRITDGSSVDSFPIWSPDASRIVFSSNRLGTLDLYIENTTEDGPEPLLESPNELRAQDWSRDGKFIIYEQTREVTKSDLWILPLEGRQEPFPFLETENSEFHAQFSPDGKWIAYTSDQNHTREVYIKSFPAKPTTWRVSTAGGYQPRWADNGRTLFYVSAERELISVSIEFEGENVRLGEPVRLFSIPVGDLEAAPQYAVSPDGNSFLVNSLMEKTGRLQLSVLARSSRY